MGKISMRNISVIVTVLNEEETIYLLLDALRKQTAKAQEIIITDGGSHDATCERIKEFKSKNPHLHIALIHKNGNRSTGRNAAIEKAQSQWIAITDAGCIPHENWLEELAKEAKKHSTKEFAVSGYYDAYAKTPFQEAVVPYVLVMPDKINPQKFLPATRSMLITKQTWQKVSGFDESLSDNEDYAFAHALKKAHVEMSFTEHAKVTWLPPRNVKQFTRMIFRFARGDVQAGIWRPKVVFLFVRYLFLICILSMALFFQSPLPLLFFFLSIGFVLYSLWAIKKNMRYVPHGWYWLPVLQFVADGAVMSGSLAGLY
jgi:glycosyltransferase involved in cell wall biosynthesis